MISSVRVHACVFLGNRPAQIVYKQVLQQLDELLSDLKQDMTKFPVSVAQLPPVSKRLGMSERGILSQLTSNKLPVSSEASTSGGPPVLEETPFPILDYYKAGPQFATPAVFPPSLKGLEKEGTVDPSVSTVPTLC